jgi:hypothetical protein
MQHIVLRMKVFNGRAATEEYMSTHSLTFSTPEMTLKKFVFWLGELVSNPKTKENVPRLMLYLEDSDSRSKPTKLSEVMPDTDDTFRPSGAVTDMYAQQDHRSQMINGSITENHSLSSDAGQAQNKSCIHCGSGLKPNSKFCISCGAKQQVN